MKHKVRLEELKKESLQNPEAYLKTKEIVVEVDQEKIRQANEEWQLPWNKLMEALMALERLEI